MTTPDRTEDLLRRMLERRAGAPPPGWLLPGVAEAVRQTGQVRGGHPWSGLLGTRRVGRLALIAAAVILLLALAAGVLVAAGLILPTPEPRLPAVVVLPSPSASAPLPAPEPTAEATDSPTDGPQPTAAPTLPAFAPDTIAVVTTPGDGLRVRSKPSVGADSKKLSPLLSKDSRMLVVRGPVQADGYDWYEVQADNDLFGWVAAGKGSEDWITAADSKCADSLDASALWSIDPIDFLACYGDTPITVDAKLGGCCDTGSTEDPACPWTGDDVHCTPRPSWLFRPRGFLYEDPVGRERVLLARTPQSVETQFADIPPLGTMTLTVAMDVPAAQRCRVVDDRGRDLMPADEAITRCRLTFAVRDLAWDPNGYLAKPDSLAVVTAPHISMRGRPGGPVLPPRLDFDDELLVVAGPVASGGVNWYAVLPYGRMGGRVGWVPSLTPGGRWTIEASPPDCPAPGDWRSVSEALPAVRLACFGSTALTEQLTVVRQQDPEPTWGGCDGYRAATPSNGPCVAKPEWLATFSGVMATDAKGRGMGVELRFEPGQIDRNSIPATPTLMQVTGSFANEAAATCQLVNPETGETLLDTLDATAYCRSQFVVTKLTAVP